MLKIGCHLSTTKGFENMGKEALEIGANTFQFFTRNPRGGKAKAIEEKDIQGLIKIINENPFSFGKNTLRIKYDRVYEYNNSTKEYERVGTVTDNKFTHTGLTTATEYTYRIKAYTKDGDETIVSSYSDTFVTATRPKAPTISKISSPSKGKVTVTWSNVSRETGYQLYYSTSKTGEYTKVTSTKANVLNASKTSLKSGKTYYFKVRAYKKTEGQTAASEWSEVKSVKVK